MLPATIAWILAFFYAHQRLTKKYIPGFVGRRYVTEVASVLFGYLLITTVAVGANYQKTYFLDLVKLGMAACLAALVWCLVGLYFQQRSPEGLRYEKKHADRTAREKLLILGTDVGSRRIASYYHCSPSIEVIGYADRDPHNIGRFINNLPIVTTESLLEESFRTGKCTTVAVPFRSERKAGALDGLSVLAAKYNVRLLPFPNSDHPLALFNRASKGFRLTPLDFFTTKVDDELFREKIRLTGKSVFVAGAGGSIGTQLVRNLIELNASKIVCNDVSEINVYNLKALLEAEFGVPKVSEKAVFVLGCYSSVAVEEALTKFKCVLAINAAAYKHVPICEENIDETLNNNVVKLAKFIDGCVQGRVSTFIQVSTDKAVNPSNIMGSSKRIGELLLMAKVQSVGSKFRVKIVRFGNVVGSSGSVFPVFERQVMAGGPVTVTHPDVERFMMMIEDAARLVLLVSALDSSRTINLLDMGEPVRILDLAKRMIVASGSFFTDGQGAATRPGSIEIKLSGLRPGEKLYEELSYSGDIRQSEIPHVLETDFDSDFYGNAEDLLGYIRLLISAPTLIEKKKILKHLVPGYSGTLDE